MINSFKFYAMACFAALSLTACGGGGGGDGGAGDGGQRPSLVIDAPNQIQGLGTNTGDPVGPKFSLPSGINTPQWSGLLVGPASMLRSQIQNDNPQAKFALATPTKEGKALVVLDGLPVDRVVGSGYSVTIRIPLVNQTNQAIEVKFPAGHIIRPDNKSAYQSGVLLKEVKVSVPANSTLTVALVAYCGNLTLSGSEPFVTYEWGVISASSTLNELIDLLVNKKINTEEYAPNDVMTYWEIADRLQTILHNMTDRGIALTDADRAWINSLPNSI